MVRTEDESEPTKRSKGRGQGSKTKDKQTKDVFTEIKRTNGFKETSLHFLFYFLPSFSLHSFFFLI
jgi:hypothetical protein